MDRLLKSPASQRGRDFGIILACFKDLGYNVEWRVINAAEYGFQQRRRRIFIFGYKNDTKYAKRMAKETVSDIVFKDGFFAKAFPVLDVPQKLFSNTELPEEIGELSNSFTYSFENSGVMIDGKVHTAKTYPCSEREQITLGDIMENGDVDEQFFIPEKRLYYTDPEIDHSDESEEKLPIESRQTWQYIKGAKKIYRKAANGHEYLFSEGPVAMIDEYDKPARTMLTSEGGFSRTTHIVKDKKTGKIRLLTPAECERIQGFPSDWTKECLVDGEIVEMPINKRRFMMGNALVVDLIREMEPVLSEIFDKE